MAPPYGQQVTRYGQAPDGTPQMFQVSGYQAHQVAHYGHAQMQQTIGFRAQAQGANGASFEYCGPAEGQSTDRAFKLANRLLKK